MGRNPATAPAVSTKDWPDQPCDDPDAEVVRLLVLNLRQAMGEGSARGVAQAAGIDHGIVIRLLAGQSWPESVTVARLERGLGVRLWPNHLGGVHAKSCADTKPPADVHEPKPSRL